MATLKRGAVCEACYQRDCACACAICAAARLARQILAECPGQRAYPQTFANTPRLSVGR